MTVWLWLRLHKHLLLRPLFFFFFSRFLFWCGPFFKGFIVTILFLFYVFVFWPCSVWDLSSPTRDWTHTPCIGRQSLNHCTARKIPPLLEVCWALPLVYWDKILSFCFGGWSGGKEHKLIRTFFFFFWTIKSTGNLFLELLYILLDTKNFIIVIPFDSVLETKSCSSFPLFHFMFLWENLNQLLKDHCRKGFNYHCSKEETQRKKRTREKSQSGY